MPRTILSTPSLPHARSENLVYDPPHSGINTNQAELQGINHTLWTIVARLFEVPPPTQSPSLAFTGFANQEHIPYQNVNLSIADGTWEAARLEENRVLSCVVKYCMLQEAARTHTPTNRNYNGN